MTNTSIAGGILVWSISVAAGAFFYGQSVQKDADEAHASRDIITQLTDIIDTGKTLASDAAEASKAMRAITDSRTRANNLTTKDLENALAKTAGNRVDCRFDADVMRQLDAARQSAAEAAAGGLRGTVPATSSAK
jgi:hypothetical protein